jgi:hypothetical protein
MLKLRILRLLLHASAWYQLPRYPSQHYVNSGFGITGHSQQEHETSHGSMSRTRWAVDGPEGTAVEVDGRKFGASDEGAPLLVSNKDNFTLFR